MFIVAKLSLRGLAGFVALIGLAAGGLRADVTAEQVWQNWQDGRAALGQKVSAGAVERQGDTLIISGIRLEMVEEGRVVSGLIGEIRLQDRGDGTVAILLPESFPVIVSIVPEQALGGLTRKEAVVSVAMPGAEITASGTPDAVSYVSVAPSVQLRTEVPDGASLVTVAVDLSGVTGRNLTRGSPERRDMTGDFAARALDLTLDVTGEADSAGRFRLSMADLAVGAAMRGIPPEGAGQGQEEAALRAGMTVDLSARYGVGSFDLDARDGGLPYKLTGAMGGGTLILSAGADHFAYDGTGKSLSLNFSGSDGAADEPISLTASLADTTGRLRIEGTDWMGAGDIDATLASGLQMSGGFGIGTASFDFAGEDAMGATRAKASLGGLGTNFALDARAMAFDLAAKAVEMSLASPEIPIPMAAMTLTEMEMDFTMPMAKSDGPAPFALLARVVDLGLGDGIWAMLDGAGMLPHDPATLVLDAEGTVTLLEDLTAADETLEGAPPPALLNRVTLNEVLLRALGAEVTGAGALAFDNADMTTFPGMPLPNGKLELAGRGLIGLMDRLVAMGMMTGEDVMGLRMMAGAFARVDPVKDEIDSVLEFRDGQLFANGNRMQ